MFLFLNAPRQVVGTFIGQDGNPGLADDRAAVQFVGDKVDAGAVLGIAGIEDPLVGIQAGIGR